MNCSVIALLFGFGWQIGEGGGFACIAVNEGFEEGLHGFFRAIGGVGHRCSGGGKAKQQGAEEVFHGRFLVKKR